MVDAHWGFPDSQVKNRRTRRDVSVWTGQHYMHNDQYFLSSLQDGRYFSWYPLHKLHVLVLLTILQPGAL